MATSSAVAGNDVVFSSTDLPVKLTGMQSMVSKMWLPWLAMGFMIVVAAFIIGLFASSTAADYFSESKAVRDAAITGSDPATDKAFIESTKVWLPAFKFLGIGMLLGGITFLLATILGNLRTGGARVQEALGAEVRVLKPPMTAMLFPMLMMMGIMILVASLIIAIVTATLSYDYWNHSIAAELNPSTSSFLSDLGTINAITLWLAPFKFVGIALLFTGIGLALATIVRVLRWQSQRLWELLS